MLSYNSTTEQNKFELYLFFKIDNSIIKDN